jgi:16S rRNA G1207 methylase RsmC
MADQLIACAPHFLAPKGRLVIVANRFLNYELNMQPYFEHITRLAETNKFHVLMATNS